LTAISGENVYLFDPYYRDHPFDDENLRMVEDHPRAYNRVVPASYLERDTRDVYALGPMENREAVLLFNRRTELTEEKTVEYMI
jgi:hypothetical protein